MLNLSLAGGIILAQHDIKDEHVFAVITFRSYNSFGSVYYPITLLGVLIYMISNFLIYSNCIY